MTEDERVCDERHRGTEFHEACHTCWKRRAQTAETNARMLAGVADRIDSVYKEVADELTRARRKFPGAQNSPHEGWAVLQEEVDELWDDVKANASREQMRKEAIQIAAMAVRFIEDLCTTHDPKRSG